MPHTNRSSIRRYLALALAMAATPVMVRAAPDSIEQAFSHPSETAKPGVWWHWMGCNVSKQGITRDLEAFKAAGISGATVFGMADVCTPSLAPVNASRSDTDYRSVESRRQNFPRPRSAWRPAVRVAPNLV